MSKRRNFLKAMLVTAIAPKTLIKKQTPVTHDTVEYLDLGGGKFVPMYKADWK